MRGLWIAALLAALAGCARVVTEEDIFVPQRAPSLTLTVSDDTGVLIDENTPRKGLFEEAGIAFEQGTLPTRVGDIAFELARQPDPSKPLIVNCHGNAGDIENHGPLTVWKLAPFGDVLMWDYPGYGASEGEPTVEHFKKVGDDLAARLKDFRRAEDQKVVFWGYSFGGFICSELAARSGLADAMVFEASGLSAETAAKGMVPRYLSWFVHPKLIPELKGYDNSRTLGPVDAPILILAGGKDGVLPPKWNAALLADALTEAGKEVRFIEFPAANHYTIAFSEGFDAIVEEVFAEFGVAD